MDEVILFQRPADDSNLLVTGLPRDITYNVLYHMFGEQGLLYELQLMTKPGTIPGGADVLTYAFVKYYSVAEATQAMLLLDGHYLRGSRIKISFVHRTKPPENPPPPLSYQSMISIANRFIGFSNWSSRISQQFRPWTPADAIHDWQHKFDSKLPPSGRTSVVCEVEVSIRGSGKFAAFGVAHRMPGEKSNRNVKKRCVSAGHAAVFRSLALVRLSTGLLHVQPLVPSVAMVAAAAANAEGNPAAEVELAAADLFASSSSSSSTSSSAAAAAAETKWAPQPSKRMIQRHSAPIDTSSSLPPRRGRGRGTNHGSGSSSGNTGGNGRGRGTTPRGGSARGRGRSSSSVSPAAGHSGNNNNRGLMMNAQDTAILTAAGHAALNGLVAPMYHQHMYQQQQPNYYPSSSSSSSSSSMQYPHQQQQSSSSTASYYHGSSSMVVSSSLAAMPALEAVAPNVSSSSAAML